MRFTVLAIILATAFYTSGQDTVNMHDSRGRKQGYWIKTDSSGSRIYEGTFTHDIPTGKFTYYYPNGRIKVISFITDSGRVARTTSYFTNGKTMAKGKYIDQKRDSIWVFFNEYDGSLIGEESYSSGKKNGPEKVFYGGKAIAERVTWKNGVKEGPWEQFFENGNLKLRGTYVNNEKDGLFESWFENGILMITGRYLNGLPEGKWVYYDEQGNVTNTVEYRQGIPVGKE
jgi:antitoxin component YwqK of YwqJK toxin-antitoxin module